MRTGPRILVACLLLTVAICAPARAADSLSVFVDNQQVALGGTTTLAAHASTDAGYGGGHVAFKYDPASSQCAADPASDPGTSADGDQPAPVNPGAGETDVGGQMIQLGMGTWRICGWLVDDATGATVAAGSALVTVVPYQGSISISVQRLAKAFEVVLSYSTSSPAHLYAVVQKAAARCAAAPGKPKRGSFLLTPANGRFVGSDGGLGRALPVAQMASGRWRVCAWLKADAGAAGPVTKTFAVPRASKLAGRVAG